MSVLAVVDVLIVLDEYHCTPVVLMLVSEVIPLVLVQLLQPVALVL